MNNTIATPTETKNILNEYNLKLYKGMGQNFLIDQNILARIVAAAELNNGDNVIEIGPGIGSLTQQLLNKLGNGKLIAIEKDSRFIRVLEDIFTGNNRLELVNRDVLEIDWDHFLKKRNLTGKPLKILGNLPYYITTPILMNFLESNLNIERLIFMVQKEVAERIVASPGTKDFGRLSVAVQFYSTPEIVYNVPPTVFIPQPGVYSSIITMTPYSVSPFQVKNREFFFRVVRAIFQQRRKNIKNSLTGAANLDLEKELVLKSLETAGIDRRIRGEKLEIEKMVQLSNKLWENYNRG